jgi:DNA-binding MarR family transcriptional regulator
LRAALNEKKSKTPPRDEHSPFDVLIHLHRDLSRTVFKYVGVSYSRLLVLHELYHAGEISQAELQRRVGIEGALLTRYAKQMEKAGLITRRADPKDNRFTLVTLAPPGVKFLHEAEKLGEEYEVRLLEGLSEEELAIMVRAMKRIQDNISRYSPPG